MNHHNTHGTLDGVEGKYDRGYVFSKVLDDRIVSSFCNISGIGICGWQFFPGEEIWFSYQIFHATFTVAVIGINDNNCTYSYFPRSYRIIIRVSNFMHLYFGLKSNEAVCHREYQEDGGNRTGDRVRRYLRYHICQYRWSRIKRSLRWKLIISYLFFLLVLNGIIIPSV